MSEPEYKPISCWMCKVDYDYHLDGDVYGTLLYASEEDLRAHRECVESCGIVEVEVHFVRVVQPGEHD